MFSPSMTEPLAIPPRPSVLKRVRHGDELAELARTFAADWRQGDRVMTWLRRHEGSGRTLSHLVADGWSWADVSRAMHLAGITYRRTGEPIPAALLCRKAYAARCQVMKRARKEAAPMPAITVLPGSVDVVRSAASTPLSAGGGVLVSGPTSQPLADPDDELEFRPARLAGWSGRARTREETHERSREATSPVPTGRADALISRLMSRK